MKYWANLREEKTENTSKKLEFRMETKVCRGFEIGSDQFSVKMKSRKIPKNHSKQEISHDFLLTYKLWEEETRK